nr:MAG TPA: minor structural protein [Caudoviricetes sp.]
MITRVQLRDRRDNLIAYINTNDLTKFQRYRVINGQHTLDMAFAPDTPLLPSLQKYNRILFYDTEIGRWFEFSIASVTQTIKSVTISGESSFYSTLCCFIPFTDVTGRTVVNGMYELFGEAYPASEWVVGTSDVTGNFYMQRTRSTLKDALMDWAQKCGGEIDPEVSVAENGTITRRVNIYKRVGEDRGLTLYDDREITDITRKVQQGDIYTAAYGVGNYVEGSDQALTFADVVWSTEKGDPVDKPAGQTYVSLGAAAIDQYGQNVGGTLVDRCTAYTIDTADPATLLERTYASLVAQLVDPTAYTIKAADFPSLGIPTSEVGFGDTVGVISTALGLRFRTRCVGKRTDYLNGQNTTYEFNERPYQVVRSISSIGQTASNAERIANESYYSGVLDKFNREINADQAYVIADPAEGFNTYNAANPADATKVTSIRGGSVRVANSKTAGQWNWSTVLTGDGLVINQLTAQKIEGENFELDMQTGLLAFGEHVNGVLKPVIQLQSTGFEILGDQINAKFSPEQMAFLNNVNGDIIAQFSAVGAEMPTAIVNDELMVGQTRFIPTTDALMIVINDKEGGLNNG